MNRPTVLTCAHCSLVIRDRKHNHAWHRLDRHILDAHPSIAGRNYNHEAQQEREDTYFPRFDGVVDAPWWSHTPRIGDVR